MTGRRHDWAARAPAAVVFALVALILAMVFAPNAGATPVTGVAVASLAARVTDLTGTLTRDQTAAIERRLAVTDATSYRILGERVIPRFQQQDFEGGISAGLQAMMDRVDPKATPAGVVATVVAFGVGLGLFGFGRGGRSGRDGGFGGGGDGGASGRR